MASESECCGGWKTGTCCESDACNPKAERSPNNKTVGSKSDDDIWESDSDSYNNSHSKEGRKSKIKDSIDNKLDEEDTYTDPIKLDLQFESVETRSIRRKFNKQGYIDGKSQWQEYGLQRGFNDGFGIGAQLGIKVGKLIAQLQIEKMKFGDHADFNFEKVIEDFEIGNFLLSEYFDFSDGDVKLRNDVNQSNNENASNHPILKKWSALTMDKRK